MFNPERLLGKLAEELITRELGGAANVAKGVAGSSALMTVIGIGVAAYEHMSSQKPQTPPVPHLPHQGAGGGTPPPPPPPAGAGKGPSKAPAPPVPSAPGPAPDSTIAIRCIQAMIAAAHADGAMDAQELKAIMERLERAELTPEEKEWLIREFQRPLSIDELCEGITDPAVARTMYMLAKSAIVVDTDAERKWLSRLAKALGLEEEAAGGPKQAPPPTPPIPPKP
jgi:uncharacterized membrane protein YebE (DUF533 family)